MLDSIKFKMEATFANEGIIAEVTFARSDMFSIFCEDATNYAKAKELMAKANQVFDGESCDDEIGFVAYYTF